MWIIFAALSAVFAALTSILAKMGMDKINSNAATAVRTVVILIVAWLIVLFTGEISELREIDKKGMVLLILSGLATGLSWLCYFRAIQIGEVSRVAPIDKFSVVITMVLAFIILKEPLTFKIAIAGGLITIGTVLLAI